MDDTTVKVLSLVNNIKESHNESKSDGKTDSLNDSAMLPSETNGNVRKKENQNVTKGKPKSGRFWKSSRDKFSSINKTNGLKQAFEKKTALRIELKRVKELSKQLKDDKKKQEELRKQRRRENLKRTEENRKKSEVVQVISNSAKVKRMRKKQLRFIEKRDTNKAPS